MKMMMSSHWVILLFTLHSVASSFRDSDGGMNSKDGLACPTKSQFTHERLYIVCNDIFNCSMTVDLFSYSQRLDASFWETHDHCKHLKNEGIYTIMTQQMGSQFPLEVYNRSMTVNLNEHLPSTDHWTLSHLLLTSMTDCDNDTKNDGCKRIQAQHCLCSIKNVQIIGYHFGTIMEDEFCAFYNAQTLLITKTRVDYIHRHAFVCLSKLAILIIVESHLKALSADIFRPLVNLDVLQLANNEITPGDFPNLSHLRKLQFIDLSNNSFSGLQNASDCYETSPVLKFSLKNDHLTHLHKEPFICMKQLHEVILDNNRIHKIDAGFFQTINSMYRDVHISLRSNHLQQLPYIDIHNIGVIFRLYLSNNNFTSIPDLGSTSLVELDLSKNKIHKITVMDKRILCSLFNLKLLDLSSNGMHSLTAEAFRCDVNSSHSDDQRNVSDSMNETFAYRTSFDGTNLFSLYMNTNQLTSFRCKDFSDHLKSLFLSENEIETFDCSKALLRPMSLTVLDLSRNKLKNLTSVILPQSLEHLNLSENKITVFSFTKREKTGEYIIPSNLIWLNLTSNFIKTLCPLWTIHSMSISLDIDPFLCQCKRNIYFQEGSKMDCYYSFHETNFHSRMNRTIQQKRIYDSCSLPLNVSCHCHTSNSYYSSCDLPCPNHCSCHTRHNSSIYSINCTATHLNELPHLLSSLANINLVLDFSLNQLQKLTYKDLTSFTTAIELYVRKNRINEITLDAFQNLTQLEVLDMESNLLEELPPGVFTSLTNLKKLNLAKNRLKHVPNDLIHFLKSLLTPTFQSNSNLTIYEIPTPNHNWKTLTHIRLSNNPWICDCDFLNDILGDKGIFSKVVKDVSEMQCYGEGDGKPLSLLSFFQRKCSADNATSIWASIIAVLLFLALITILTFVYRHELQVILYSQTSFRFFKQDSGDVANKRFDAFIAHSGDDVEFVAVQLIPGLEKIERPYRVCVHDRDFLAGAPIMDNIQEAVEHSQCTLVVLTENFVQSHWCAHEFKMAHHQMTLDQNSRVIVIVVDEIPSKVPPEIKFYLRSNTYLKWKDKLFWQKLYFAMPNQRIEEIGSQLSTLSS